jgi:ribonucleotide reductase alpha subunit
MMPTVIDFTQVRGRGEPIKSFGGTASGPAPLRDLVKSLTKLLMPKGVDTHWTDTSTPDKGGTMTLMLLGAGGWDEDPTETLAHIEPYRITSPQIVDIYNYIGKAVVAGGVRRSAEILFGDPDDQEFINLKQDKEALTDRRWASNNSIFGKVGMDYSEIAELIADNGEPGILWLDNVRRFSRMADPPDNKDYRAMGSNPCFAGDTLIAVADGRGAVPIKQLVDEGFDVPVYSVSPEGRVEIKLARNPRQTRDSAQLVEVELDDGTTFRVTPDHKMRLLDGTKCEAQNLEVGDSLPRFTRRLTEVKPGGSEYWQVVVDTQNPRGKGGRVFEHRLIAQFNDPEGWDRTYDAAKQSGWVKGGLVVHHKDFNPLNNSPDNLKAMTFADHAALHARDMVGDKNPMWGRIHTEESKRKIGAKTKERCSDPIFLAKLAASHTAAERVEASSRMSEKRQQEWLVYYKEQEASTKLDTVWMDGRLHAVLSCETCSDEFIVPWRVRGQCYCNRACMNKAESHIQARKAGQRVTFDNRQRQTLHEQVRIFKDLSGDLGRTPKKKEWEASCREGGVPFRLRKAGSTANPHALSSYKHLQEVAGGYNHRVKSVRFLDQEEPVYNLSVEDHHTLAVVTTVEDQRLSGIFCANCVEQSLESYELCCLVESFPAHHDSLEDYMATLKKAYLYAKTVTLVPTHDPRTNAVMMRNRRIGCSMSGIVQAINKLGRRTFLDWCDGGYGYIQDLDKSYPPLNQDYVSETLRYGELARGFHSRDSPPALPLLHPQCPGLRHLTADRCLQGCGVSR